MLRLAVLICCALLATNGQRITLVNERNVLSPPYFNIATGKQIEATSTCGENGPDVFCKLTGGPNDYASVDVYQGQYCDVCDNRNPVKTHSVQNAIDGTEKWWQSPPLSKGKRFNRVNVTIHLGQVFHVAYILIKFANSPRAGTWVLERSSDDGKTYQPWQYFANSDSDCHNMFGVDAHETITRDDTVLCTSDYSDVVPLENGEVIVSLINQRPGAKNFSHSPVLQEWSKATDVRLRLLRTKTLLGHLMAVEREDPTVTRRYFYSIKDVSIGGRCVCNGHAETCLPDPRDRYKLKCQCTHNTCGDSCEMCCPDYVQKAWAPAVPENAHECEPCNCHEHSNFCHYDKEVARRRQSLDIYGNYEGGGVCENCLHHTAGINCEECVDGYYRPASYANTDPNGCRPCNCDGTFTVGTCEPITGRCYCKPKYAGDRCDRCAPGYYEFPECKPCPCFYNGTRDGICQPQNGVCPCKYNYIGEFCDSCAPEFYDFPDCRPCNCNGSVESKECDQFTGECPCIEGFGGQNCDECSPGYYNYPLCQICICTTFTAGGVCNPETGECYCNDLITGPSCTRCWDGYYDFPDCKLCSCSTFGSVDERCDGKSGKCRCEPNYTGDKCDECAPEYFDYPNCTPCNCNIYGSKKTTCDQYTGQCICEDHITGQLCDQCAPDYFNFPTCEDCKCNQYGIKEVIPGICLAFSIGQCDCKENVQGLYCDECKPLHYDLTKGCINCNCYLQGTLDGVAACDSEDGQCWCKPYTCTQRCSQCDDGFYGLREANYLGCDGCQCDVGGSIDYVCDKKTGDCSCKIGVHGRQCNKVVPGTYFPSILEQYKFEVEDGFTADRAVVRYLSDEAEFPGFSMKGYAVFSSVQEKVTVPVFIDRDNLYKMVFYYTSNGSVPVTLTFEPQESTGKSQMLHLNLQHNMNPSFHKVTKPFFLNTGIWNVIIEANHDALIDYFSLLPLEYYEPGILQVPFTEPCVPQTDESEELCVMYSHQDISLYSTTNFAQFAAPISHAQPTSSHPLMVYLDSNSTENSILPVILTLTSDEYVFVLEYASEEKDLQTITATVTDIFSLESYEVKFNIYNCAYSLLCRQVGLTTLGGIMHLKTTPKVSITLKANNKAKVFVGSLTAIPYNEWSMNMTEPKAECINHKGPLFETCSTYSYPIESVDLAPENECNAEKPPAVDLSISFFEKCFSLAGLSKMSSNISDLCKDSTFSLTTDYNDGSLPCDCHENGTVGGDLAICEEFGGQCPCKPNIIGRECSICKPGFFGFPDCQSCDCGSAYCDEITGECICPPNTIKPNCSKCVPSTHSFHPLDGCIECDCNLNGVENTTDLGCDMENGQCRCSEKYEGRKCDKCTPGFYGFPECKPCVCQESGRINEGCNPVTGNCECKENVEGQQCDRCKPGTFHLDATNPLGCTSCFCFGVSEDCHSTQYPLKQISNMDGWFVENLGATNPDLLKSTNGETITVYVRDNGGVEDTSYPHIYWIAPEDYLFDKVGSYGADLSFTTDTDFGGRGDSPGVSDDLIAALPAADVILQGNGLIVMSKNKGVSGDGKRITIKLNENNFVHQNDLPVKREDLMLILADLYYLKIRATSNSAVLSASLSNVEMATVDYEQPIGSGETIPTVEECICPEEYGGKSCELCKEGHYRNTTFGPYLGVCLQCDCYGHCLTCDDSGPIQDCLHNTAGDHCEECKDGYIGNPQSGDPDSCKPCPCPYQTEGRNFADSCGFDDDGQFFCKCKEGYAGTRCEECAYGYFGNPRVIGGECKKCNCHGNQDPNMLMEVCDSLTGECSDCIDNTGGKYCERCADGYFGDAITERNCTQCACFGCGTQICDYQWGYCSCKPHVLGESCDYCEPGYFDINSCVACFDCQCGIGALSKLCDETSGKCECAPNVVGHKCDKCEPGHWNYSETGCQPCNCRDNGACNPDNGACTCPPGVTGPQCDECKLPRHVLHHGEQVCKGCDECIDILLDTIEPITARTKEAAENLDNVSLGLAAEEQLNKYEQEFADILGNMKAMDDFFNTTEAYDPLFDQLENDTAELENKTEEVCSLAEELLADTNNVGSTTNETYTTVTELYEQVDAMANDTIDFVTKLLQEASEDNEEYANKLKMAEDVIEEMQNRNFTDQNTSADDELKEAEDLLDIVNGNFSGPADDINKRITELSDDLANKEDKMKQLRTLLNNATKTVTDVNVLNDANRERMDVLKDMIDAINKQFGEIDRIVNEAEKMVDGIDPSSIELLDTTLLNEEVLRLQPVVDELIAGLDRVQQNVTDALEHAKQLEEDAAVLNQIVEETKSEPKILRAMEAANRYQSIINAMNDAKEAADKALADAMQAQKDVADKDLDKTAKKANERASQLLSDVDNMKNKDMKELENGLNEVMKGIEVANESVANAEDRLDKLNEDLQNLDPGDTLKKAEEAKNISAEAENITEDVNKLADEMQDKLDMAPDPNVDVIGYLENAREALANIKEDVTEFTETVDALKQSAERISKIPEQTKMDDKINEIRKKIDLARDLAGIVKAAMPFDKTTTVYTQPRIPPQLCDLEKNLDIELYLNTSYELDNSVLYFGDASSKNGDFVILETADGYVRYTYKVGDGVGVLQSDKAINDNDWHHIKISRMNNNGMLKVGFPVEPSRSDSDSGITTEYEEKSGTTNGEEIVSILPPNSTLLFVGGLPLQEMPDGIKSSMLFGWVQNVKINKQYVGLYNFNDYNGQQPADVIMPAITEVEIPNSMWKFQGFNSYIRIGQDYLKLDKLDPTQTNFIVQMKIQTSQENGLLFLIGSSVNQFFALEIRNSKVVLTCNFNFPTGVYTSTADEYDGLSNSNLPATIKTAVHLEMKLILLAINNQLYINQPMPEFSTNLQDQDAWLGGIYSTDVIDELKPHVTTIDTHYQGCMGNIAIISKIKFDPYKAKEKIGVEKNCSPKDFPECGMDGNAFGAGASDVTNVAEVPPYDNSERQNNS